MKNDRLFQMLYLLLEKGSMTAPQLADGLEVSVRTVYRDVETLSGAGVPIYASSGRGGGISLMPGYSFDKTLLSDDEQNELLFAVQSLRAADQQVDGLLHKLGAAFQKPQADWIKVEFSRWGMNRTDTKRFEILKNAILGRQVLKITYFGASSSGSSRAIHPLRLIYKDKNWYLQAFCLRSKDFRLFKAGRIVELEPTGEIFDKDYSGAIPPIEPEEPVYSTIHIRLRFSPRIAFRVYDEFDHDHIMQQPDGSLIAQVDFPLDTWVINYLFSFGTDLEVLEPLNLKEQLAQYAEKVSAHHKT